MLFFYVRHGDPIYDPDSLTPLGYEQAKALAKRFAIYGLDEIYASTSERAKLTAKPTCDLLKKEMQLCDWANEGHAWAETTVTRVDGSKIWSFFDSRYIEKFNSPQVRALGQDWYKHPDFANDNFGKGVQRVNAAADEFFLSLGYKHDRENNRYEVIQRNSKRIALFAHQGFAMSFLSSVLDIPYPMFCTHFDLGHSSMTVINFEDGGPYVFPKVLQLSNDSHLYKEGILTGYGNRIKF